MKPISRKYVEVLLAHQKNSCTSVTEEAATMPDATVRRCCMTYLDLLKVGGGTVPRFMGPYLDEVAIWCQKNHWPCLDSLIVNDQTGEPGEGYFARVHSGGIERWRIEVRKCIAFRGYPERMG